MLQRPFRALARRLGRRLSQWGAGSVLQRADALSELAMAGCVHPTVQWRGTLKLPAGAEVRVGADSIFCGRLTFHRPGQFRMGQRSYVGPQTEIRVTTAIEIGDDVLISWGCTLMDTDMHALLFSERCRDVLIEGGRRGLTAADKEWSSVRCRPITIRSKAWIGMRVIILPGVTIGEGCIVGAGSVVTRDLPAWTVSAGNPARVLRSLPAMGREIAEQAVSDRTKEQLVEIT